MKGIKKQSTQNKNLVNDFRVGLNPPSVFKNPLKWYDAFRYRIEHKCLHNKNKLFYTASPMLLEGIIKAFNIQVKKRIIGRNLLDGYAYYEFGVFKGFSLWFAEMYARQCSISDFYFYGFDSFEGLPKSRVDGMKPAYGKGHFMASYKSVVEKFEELGVDFDRVKLYKGFYSEFFFNYLSKRNNFLPASICLIDSDIYESSVDVLNFIKDYLVSGSIIIFDDYNAFNNDEKHGDRKAIAEFENKNPNFKKEYIFDFGWHGVGFEVKNI